MEVKREEGKVSTFSSGVERETVCRNEKKQREGIYMTLESILSILGGARFETQIGKDIGDSVRGASEGEE